MFVAAWKRAAPLAFAAAVTAVGADAPSRDPAFGGLGLFDLILKTREARIAGNRTEWLRFGKEIVARVPDHPDFLFSVGRAAAANGDKALALALLEQGLDRGASYALDAPPPELAPLKDDPAFARLAQRDRDNAKPVARASVFARIPDKDFAPEGIAHDASASRFLVGSMKGAIWQVDRAGRPSAFVPPADTLLPVLGMKVDGARNLLWAVNTIYPDFPPPPQPKPGVGLAAINAYDLGTGALRARHVLDERPTIHGFNDIVVARNGDAFVTDSPAGAIYKLDRAREKLARVFGDRGMTMPNGLALSADERTLYVAHVEGISAVDLATSTRRLVATTRTMALGSIDGLASTGRSLIGIQPSPYLQRVIRIDLDSTGLVAERVTVLNARSHPALQQTTGVIVGDAFFAITHPAPVPPGSTGAGELPAILRIPLRD